MFLAKSMVMYVGIASFSPNVYKNGVLNRHPRDIEDFTVSNENVIEWLYMLGAENIIDSEELSAWLLQQASVHKQKAENC